MPARFVETGTGAKEMLRALHLYIITVTYFSKHLYRGGVNFLNGKRIAS